LNSDEEIASSDEEGDDIIEIVRAKSSDVGDDSELEANEDENEEIEGTPVDLPPKTPVPELRSMQVDGYVDTYYGERWSLAYEADDLHTDPPMLTDLTKPLATDRPFLLLHAESTVARDSALNEQVRS
jgi:hypothetical protein